MHSVGVQWVEFAAVQLNQSTIGRLSKSESANEQLHQKGKRQDDAFVQPRRENLWEPWSVELP